MQGDTIAVVVGFVKCVDLAKGFGAINYVCVVRVIVRLWLGVRPFRTTVFVTQLGVILGWS